MKKNWAILDLGTNTFHLLIVSIEEDQSFSVLFKAEKFVKMGEDGLDKIGEKPFLRGVNQIKEYKQVIDQYQPERIVAFGTAAIRRASNGDAFIQAIKEVCPMEVRKISGDEEAQLIYYGVRQAVKMDQRISLIMDIGGGSTEFIFANNEKIFWMQSFPLGGSVLQQKFHHSEPIAENEIHQLENFLNKELQPLISQSAHFPILQLIGASGSFDSIAMIISEKFFHQPLDSKSSSTEINLQQFHEVYGEMLHSTLEERLQMKGLVPFRAEMMVVATILVNYVIEKLGIKKMTQSAYALKEGVLWKMLRNESI